MAKVSDLEDSIQNYELVSLYDSLSDTATQTDRAALEKLAWHHFNSSIKGIKLDLSEGEARAKSFAIKAHGDQKYGNAPYEYHLVAVTRNIKSYGLGGDFVCAGWLHDTLEDTNTGPEDIENIFGLRVYKLVWAVTGVGETRKDRVADAYKKIAAYPDTLYIKLPDRIANSLSARENRPDLFDMYKKEYPSFKATLYPIMSGHVLEDMWEYLDSIYA